MKAPNVENQFPTVVLRHLMQVAPSGHSCECDAVFDDVVKFTVGEVLRFYSPQVRYTWVKGLSGRRRTATVTPVAIRASREEIIPAIIQVLRCELQRVLPPVLFHGDCKIAHGSRNHCLKSGWLCSSPKTSVNQ